jgi:hypothetical protein
VFTERLPSNGRRADCCLATNYKHSSYCWVRLRDWSLFTDRCLETLWPSTSRYLRVTFSIPCYWRVRIRNKCSVLFSHIAPFLGVIGDILLSCYCNVSSCFGAVIYSLLLTILTSVCLSLLLLYYSFLAYTNLYSSELTTCFSQHILCILLTDSAILPSLVSWLWFYAIYISRIVR